ncbi:MAG: hypothetical protein ACYC48_02855 [Minisyncoccota bacterium]
MSFNNPFKSGHEKIPAAAVEVEREFAGFVPAGFVADPVGYFEREGKNIKTGDIKKDETGRVREDPTAVKDFPVWKDENGAELQTVARRVNPSKGAVGESRDPFYEYRILERLHQMDLPVARPIARAEQGGAHVIVMERIPGIRWSERESLLLRERGYSDEDIAGLQAQAQQKMDELQQQFEAAGVIRGWKLKDMVFQIDLENKRILAVVPTDWERTRIEEKSI